jgi:predicted permease
VLKSVVLNPLPYANADGLVRIVHNIGGIEQPYFNDGIIATYADHAQAFESFGVWIPSSQGVTVTGNGDPEEVRALAVSRGLLTTLGVQPEIGRWFSSQDDSPGSTDTVMIGNGYWRQKYGGDRSVLGRSIIINARPWQIIGVMPAHSLFIGEFDVLMPLRINPARPVSFFRLNGVARMKPDTTLAQANADIARMLEIYFDNFHENTTRAVRWVPSLVPLKQHVLGDVGSTLWVLMGTTAVLLLMACTNVANLLLVRTESRRQEFAIRAALGASRARLAGALLIESLLLATMGGAMGVAIASAGIHLLVAMEPGNLPRLSEISLDPPTIVFAVCVTLAAGLLLSAIPIVKSFASRFTPVLGTRTMTVTRERQRSQDVLVALQLALALVLLVSCGLMIRSFQALRRIEPGFAQALTLQTFGLTIPITVASDLDQVTRIHQEILNKVAAIPGVTSAAFTTRLPMDPRNRWSAALSVDGQPHDGQKAPPNRQVKLISPGAFQTFGTPLVAGRDFTWTDLYELRDVAIVSENLAREYWGSGQAAVGQRIRQFYGAPGPWREVVGVAPDVYDDGVYRQAPATVYWPARLDPQVFGPYQPRRVSFVIRTDRAGTHSLLEELRQAVSSVNPTLPLAQVTTLDVLYDRSMSRTSFTLVLLAITASVALLLGLGGVYGVVAYAVGQRRREIGIRMALGAQARQVRALFLRRGMIVATAGLLLGLCVAAAFAQLMQSVVFGIEPLDPITFTTMALVLASTALLATFLSAHRALWVNPVETMRAE